MLIFNKLFVFRIYMSSARILINFFAWTPFYKDYFSSAPNRIIIFRTCALGDFILSVPTFKAIRERFPQARICLVTASSSHAQQRERVRSYAGRDSLPWLKFVVPSIIDEVIYVDSFDMRSFFKRHRKSVCEFNPDLTIHVSEGSSSTLSLIKKIFFLRMLGVKGQILGLNRSRSLRFFRNLQYEAGIYKPRVLELLESTTDIPNMPKSLPEQVEFPLNLSKTESQFGSNLWRAHGLDERIVIAMAPGAVQPHKRWPLNAFADLCRKLIDEFNVCIIVMGPQTELASGKLLESISDNKVINLIGKTSISESASLFTKIAFLVSNDGGAVHLASAFNCPVISIISGIEYPGSIEPWNSPDLSVRIDTPCSPCYSFTCCPQSHNKCIKNIPVESVMTQCRKAMQFSISRRT